MHARHGCFFDEPEAQRTSIAEAAAANDLATRRAPIPKGLGALENLVGAGVFLLPDEIYEPREV
jgi:hypothetical protein